MKIVIEFARNVFYSSEKSGNLATKAQRNYKKYDRRQFTLDPRHFTLDSRQYTLDPRLMFRKLRRAWRASPYSWIQSATLNKNHLSIHNQQRRECPSFWLDGHLPPSGNHTILLLERIPHFNFPNSVIHDQVPFPDLLRTAKRFLWLLWPLPAIFSSSWKEFSPSWIALNPLLSAFHRRIKGSGLSCGKDESFFNRWQK